MNAKRFLDTNLFVYANDTRDRDKQDKAIRVVAEAIRSSSGVISTQVLMEYAAVAVSKLRQDRAAVVRQLLSMERLEIVPVDGALVRTAVDLIAAHSLSFWDAAILAAAQGAHCDVLLSEDLGSNSLYGAVRVRNPFLG